MRRGKSIRTLVKSHNHILYLTSRETLADLKNAICHRVLFTNDSAELRHLH